MKIKYKERGYICKATRDSIGDWACVVYKIKRLPFGLELHSEIGKFWHYQLSLNGTPPEYKDIAHKVERTILTSNIETYKEFRV